MRLLVLLLLALNGLYFGWTQGWFAGLGLAPGALTEPQRHGQQVAPERIRLLAASEARQLESAAAAAATASAAAAAAGSTVCLIGGLFDEAKARTVRQALEQAGLPAGSWVIEPATEPARWIIYMGPYPSADAVNRKRAELRGIGVVYSPLVNPALEPGLSLGRFASSAEATTAMNGLTARGVRTARVVQEVAEVRGFQLRVVEADSTQRTRLDELSRGWFGKSLQPCR
jgi:hypothetical protein